MSIVIHGLVSNLFFYLKQDCLYHCLFHYQVAEINIMKFKFNCKLAKWHKNALTKIRQHPILKEYNNSLR